MPAHVLLLPAPCVPFSMMLLLKPALGLNRPVAASRPRRPHDALFISALKKVPCNYWNTENVIKRTRSVHHCSTKVPTPFNESSYSHHRLSSLNRFISSRFSSSTTIILSHRDIQIRRFWKQKQTSSTQPKFLSIAFVYLLPFYFSPCLWPKFLFKETL